MGPERKRSSKYLGRRGTRIQSTSSDELSNRRRAGTHEPRNIGKREICGLRSRRRSRRKLGYFGSRQSNRKSRGLQSSSLVDSLGRWRGKGTRRRRRSCCLAARRQGCVHAQQRNLDCSDRRILSSEK